MTTTVILSVADPRGYYDKSHMLQDVALTMGEGELVTLLDHNDAGKSTAPRAIAGVVMLHDRQVRFRGRGIAGQLLYRIAAQNLCLMPEYRGIFKLLTIEEDLELDARRDSPWQLTDIYRILPRLRERWRNGNANLSDGEQQMFAIGHAFMNHPHLLILDEPVEGLAPAIVEEIVAQLEVIKQAGVSILLVKRSLEVCTQLADRHVVVEQGRVVCIGTNKAFRADGAIKGHYLGVGLTA